VLEINYLPTDKWALFGLILANLRLVLAVEKTEVIGRTLSLSCISQFTNLIFYDTIADSLRLNRITGGDCVRDKLPSNG